MKSEKWFIKVIRNGLDYRIEDPRHNRGDGIMGELEIFLDDSDCWSLGDSFTFEVVEMTQAEYDALPEFEGW